MYNIRYTKLNFVLQVKNDCKMPYFKNSALRGGMGKMLMEFSCLGDGNCDDCKYFHDCIVDKVMYSKLKYKPDFIANETSVGYILECFDKKTNYKKGELLKFNLILFGDTIRYISYFIYAFDVLGKKGIGKYYSKYKLEKVLSENGREIFINGEIIKNNILVKKVSDYIVERKKQLLNVPSVIMNFISPFRYKYQGHYKSKIDINDLDIALNRRINILNAYEGIRDEINIKCNNCSFTSENLNWSENQRYSSRQDAKMKLGGVEGSISLNINNEDFLELLIAGELVHIGKNSSFGLGKYILF